MERSGTRSIIFTIAFLILTAAILLNGFVIFQGMQQAVKVCLETMIPSLYAMMILSNIFVTYGFHNVLGKLLNIPAKLISGCTGQVLAVFLFSQTAGYPVGAGMLLKMHEQGQLSKKQASLLSGVCFGGGPAFILSLFQNKKEDAAAVFLAGLLANFILFIFICPIAKTKANTYSSSETLNDSSFSLSGAITNASSESARALLKICAMIVMFGGITSLIKHYLGNNISGSFYIDTGFSFLEISHVTHLFPYSANTLPFIGAALSFGGICVLMQLAAVTKGKINIITVLIIRLAASALTWIILYLRKFIEPVQSEAAAALWSASSAQIRSYSPVPSLCLLAMTFILIASTEKKR